MWPLVDDQVEPPVLVEVGQGQCPSRSVGRVSTARPGLVGPVLEEHRAVGESVRAARACACSPKKWVMITSGSAVAVVVAVGDPHVGLGLPLAVEGDAPGGGDVLERAVAPVAPEGVGLGVVGDEDVDPAVAVEVGGQARPCPGPSPATPARAVTSVNVPSPSLR